MSYAAVADLYNRFGQTNVQAWADLDGDQDALKIGARLQLALDCTANDIDAAARSKYYVVPLTAMDASTALQVMQLNRDSAAVWLYFSRGQLGTEGVQDPRAGAFNALKKQCDAQIMAITNGTMRLVAAAVWGALNPRAPVVIC